MTIYPYLYGGTCWVFDDERKGAAAMGHKFTPGDLVYLKSGGPKMTIQSWVGAFEKYECVWFEKDKRQHERFGEETLISVDEKNAMNKTATNKPIGNL